MLEEKNLGPIDDGEPVKDESFLNIEEMKHSSPIEDSLIDNTEEDDTQEPSEPRVSLKELIFQEAGKGVESENTKEQKPILKDTEKGKNLQHQNDNERMADESEKKDDTRMTLKELFERQQAKIEAMRRMDEENPKKENSKRKNPIERSIPVPDNSERKRLDEDQIRNEIIKNKMDASSQEQSSHKLHRSNPVSHGKEPLEIIPPKPADMDPVVVSSANDAKELEDTKVEDLKEKELIKNIVSSVLKSEREQKIHQNKDEILPETFEELVAETPKWTPLVQVDKVKAEKNTIEGAIFELYDMNRPEFKYPILNNQDKDVTEFDITDGIYVYSKREPFDHWHFITHKLSALYETLWDGPKLSGVGFELTFRLRKTDGEKTPPDWAVSFIQGLSGYAYTSGNFMANGHVVSVSSILNTKIGDALKAIAVIYDPDLKTVDTLAGKREFLQVYGIHVNEQIAMQSWNSLKIMELMARHAPLYITDQNRRSLMDNKDFEKAINVGVAKDGSSTGVLFAESLKWKKENGLFSKKFVVRMDAGVALALKAVIRGRIPKGRDLIISGNECKMVFKPSPKSYAKLDEDQLEIGISPKSFHDFITKISGRSKSFYVMALGRVKFYVKR